jgi:hypothetical protein
MRTTSGRAMTLFCLAASDCILAKFGWSVATLRAQTSSLRAIQVQADALFLSDPIYRDLRYCDGVQMQLVPV